MHHNTMYGLMTIYECTITYVKSCRMTLDGLNGISTPRDRFFSQSRILLTLSGVTSQTPFQQDPNGTFSSFLEQLYLAQIFYQGHENYHSSPRKTRAVQPVCIFVTRVFKKKFNNQKVDQTHVYWIELPETNKKYYCGDLQKSLQLSTSNTPGKKMNL